MKTILIIIFGTLLLISCGSEDNTSNEKTINVGSTCIYDPTKQTGDSVQWDKLLTVNTPLLSEYQLFTDPETTTKEPQVPGLYYELNSTLFTDHASKYRFLFIPPGCSIDYRTTGALDFPAGSVLVKNFSMPASTDNLGIENETLLEVRLLIKRQVGWVALTYKWDNILKDGKHWIIGSSIEIPVTHNDVSHLASYSIPSTSECLICHEKDSGTTPIGQKAQHLNMQVTYKNKEVNQLTLWKDLGLISNLPENNLNIEKIPNWKDKTQPLHNRAKAYLDINCAHCHSDEGAGALSGLRLEYWRPLGRDHGVCKTSQGWRGGYFDIWPGDSENSGIPKRIRHTEAKDRMPPIGRSLVDEEAAQLISDWIDAMEYEVCSGQ